MSMTIPAIRYDTLDEFFESLPQTESGYVWLKVDGQVAMLFDPPTSQCEQILLYMRRSEDNWAEPGDVDAWDGNRYAPTLEGSILVPGKWHGFIRNGIVLTLDYDGGKP